jgi:hypothetical protein
LTNCEWFGTVLATKERKMKIEADTKPTFTPFKIVIETPEDAAKMYAILRCARIVDTLEIGDMSDMLRQDITRFSPNVSQDSDVWFDKLLERIRKF